MSNSNNSCGCNNLDKCKEKDCACPVLISTDCVNNLTEDLACSNILKGQTLTEALKQLDAFICTKFDSVANFFQLINVGTGAGVYKGINLLGKKQLKSLVDSELITITETDDEITIAVDEDALLAFIPEVAQNTYSVANTGTGAGVYKDSTVVGDNTQFNLRKIKSSNSSVTVTEGTNEIDLTVVAATPPDGSETKVTAGTNVTVTGVGTIASPYIVNSTVTGGAGTVTDVAALTLGTTGTDLSSSVANGTTTPVITLNVPTASASNRGVLSTTDWSTFNGKAPLASPTFTGIPAAPTAAPGTNTTQVATTAFVTAAVTASGATSGSYTPTASSLSAGISTVNNLNATYTQVGNIVNVQVQFDIGTTSPTVGRKTFRLTLPVNRTDTANRIVGSGQAENTGVDMYPLQVELLGSNTTQANIIFFNPTTSSTSYVSVVNFQYSVV